mmetsp:Transcript_60224/g.120826  ORF Transcript_60224/g.120826 Transcript_60224/m.120826 type:complete len:227 (-) Transcript_60224:303-983(-)
MPASSKLRVVRTAARATARARRGGCDDSGSQREGAEQPAAVWTQRRKRRTSPFGRRGRDCHRPLARVSECLFGPSARGPQVAEALSGEAVAGAPQQRHQQQRQHRQRRQQQQCFSVVARAPEPATGAEAPAPPPQRQRQAPPQRCLLLADSHASRPHAYAPPRAPFRVCTAHCDRGDDGDDRGNNGSCSGRGRVVSSVAPAPSLHGPNRVVGNGTARAAALVKSGG